MKQKLFFILTSLLISSSFAAAPGISAKSTSGSSGGANAQTTTGSQAANGSARASSADEDASPSTAASTSDSTPKLGPDKVVLNFENADIPSVIKAIGQLSGKNFVVDPRVKGTINIVSNQPVSKADSYKVLESALRMQGFATVEADGVIKVLPETDAKTYGMKTFGSSQAVMGKKNPGDQVVTKVFVLQHGSAMQMSNSLRPLIAPNNSISVYPASNALVITDYSSNIARITNIVNQLSTPRPAMQQSMVIPFKHAIAADVAQVLQNYLQGGGGSGGPGGGGGATDGPAVTITTQSQTNSILLYSTSREKLNEMQNIALNMDKTIGDSNNDLHVVYLKNADATHIADVLRVVITNQENTDITATSASSKFTTEPSGVFTTSGSGGGGGGGGGSSAFGNRGGSQGGYRPGQNMGGQNNAQKDQPKMYVQAEPTTNSLIIQAPEAIYRNLRMIIDMLDVRRAQVMIEAMIADINATNQGTFGIQWLVGGGSNNAGGIGVANYAGNGSALSSLATTALAVQGASSGNAGAGAAAAAGGGGISIPNEVYVGLVTGTTTIGGQTIPSLSTLADMISATSSGNILSRPTLITLDNEEAKIQVGSNIGIPNGSFTATSGSPGNLTTTITRQDLGTFLQIKPKITQNGSIQLDIYQEDSQLSPNQPANSANGPSFLKRTMRSTILLDDGQIIALGGMTSDTISLTQNGIPVLSAIPYLGWLFSWQSRTHTKANLVLFLRPVIIRNAEGYKALTNQRYQYVMDQQNLVQAKGNILLPDIKAVNLENQVNYDYLVPKQKNVQPETPLVDVRAGTIKAKAPATTTTFPSVPDTGANVSVLTGDSNPVTVTNVTK
jgi:general secretion pathway protein D